jgi:hypothetical protein
VPGVSVLLHGAPPPLLKIPVGMHSWVRLPLLYVWCRLIEVCSAQSRDWVGRQWCRRSARAAALPCLVTEGEDGLPAVHPSWTVGIKSGVAFGWSQSVIVRSAIDGHYLIASV